MAASQDRTASALGPWPAREAIGTPPCPVDRWPRRRRNKICIAIMAIGALNFVCYTFTYAMLGGDAHNGYRQIVQGADGTRQAEHYVRGHFIRNPAGEAAPVSEAAWIYSYVHSISMWLTSGAMIISMLVLARPHIVATMRDGWISGQTFVTVLGTIVVLGTLAAAGLFTWDFLEQLLIS
jgi:hypothetical protein